MGGRVAEMDDEHPLRSDLLAAADRLEDQWRWPEALEAWEAARAAAGDDPSALGDCEAGRARVLLALDRLDDASAADDAARAHYEAAGLLALALVCAADQAWQLGVGGDLDAAMAQATATVDALDALDRAAAGADVDDDDDDEDDQHELRVARGRARQVLARLLFASDRADEGVAAYLAARDLFADDVDARRVARCDAALALDLLGVGRVEDAEGRAEAALAAFSVLDAEADAGRMDMVLGQIRAQSGERLEESLASFGSAKERFVAAGVPAFQAEALHLEGLVLASLGRDDDAIDAFEEAVEVGEAAGLDAGVALTRLELGPALARLGHDDEAVRCLDAAREQLTELADGLGLARAAYSLAGVHREHGRPAEALDELRAAATLFEDLGLGAATGQVRLDGGALLDALAHQTEPTDVALVHEALGWFDQAIAAFETDDDPRFVAIARRAWGTTAGFADHADGLDAIESARGVLSEHHADWEVAECDAAAARVLGHLRRFEEGAAKGAAAVAGFEAAGDPVAGAATSLLLGQLLADGGQGDAALDVLGQVATAGADLGIAPLAGAAHAALAGVLDGLGRPEEAAPHQAAAQRLLGDV
ncbi:MAG: hypothetical protein JWN46_1688 [Acidimicrobiales bacterium]|nr:hypothetical protein [Acidimicrobiales bacterium]